MPLCGFISLECLCHLFSPGISPVSQHRVCSSMALPVRPGTTPCSCIVLSLPLPEPAPHTASHPLFTALLPLLLSETLESGAGSYSVSTDIGRVPGIWLHSNMMNWTTQGKTWWNNFKSKNARIYYAVWRISNKYCLCLLFPKANHTHIKNSGVRICPFLSWQIPAYVSNIQEGYD